MRWILSLGLCLMLGLAACGPRETAAPAELLDRGVRLQIQGDNEGALACYHRAATLAGDGDLALQALAYLRMAVLYTNSYVASGEDIDKYRTALRLYTRLADTTQMVTCLRAMGMQLAQSDADSATHYLSRAVALLSERADTVGQSECLEALARTQYAAGNYRLALQMSQMSIAACHPAPEAAYCDAAMAWPAWESPTPLSSCSARPPRWCRRWPTRCCVRWLGERLRWPVATISKRICWGSR